MKSMIEFDGNEIERFNNDNACVSFHPKENCKFILQIEKFNGQLDIFHKVYILHIDENGKEIERWDAMSTSVTNIKWK